MEILVMVPLLDKARSPRGLLNLNQENKNLFPWQRVTGNVTYEGPG